MKNCWRICSTLWVMAVVTACGQAPRDVALRTAASEPPTSVAIDSPAGEQLYEATGLVLDTPDGDPELCVGVVMESLPPQCEGIPIARWDWTQVDGEDKAGGTTWGTFNLVGNYERDVFTVHEAGPPESGEAEQSDPVDVPCAEPPGGWTVADPDRASQEQVFVTQREVSREPDFAGLWIDYYNQPPGGSTEEDPGNIILTVAFTGDLERHERELRELWGGPLCLTQHDHTLQELKEIQNGFPGDEFDLDVLWSDIDVVRGVVEIGVVAIDAETLKNIEERYGDSAVEVNAQLKPVG